MAFDLRACSLAGLMVLAAAPAAAFPFQSERGLKIYREQRQDFQRKWEADESRRRVVESCERRGGGNCAGESARAGDATAAVGMLGGTLATMAERLQTRQVETVKILSEADKRQLIETQAAGGNMAAAVLAGDIYRAGYQVGKDESKALDWYEKAAALGDVNSQIETGWAYLLGEQRGKNPATAARWFELAANQGNGEAQYILGVLNSLGLGLPVNDPLAVQWYLKAAASGHAAGQYAAGIRHHDGNGVPQDYALALKWFAAAAEQGHSDAQYNLAVMHSKSRGVAPSWAAYQTAQKWYERAAEAGNVNAQFMACMNLGSGIGVAKDLRKALLWCERAVAQGDDEAADLIASIQEEARKVGYGGAPTK